MKLLLDYKQAPGDTVCSTSAVQSMLDDRPDIEVFVKGTSAEPTFRNFPRVKYFQGETVDKAVVMTNDLINKAHLHHHFLWSYCATLSEALQFPVRLKYNRPVLHLSKEERGWTSRVHELKGKSTPYHVLSQPGAKSDFTVKRYARSYLQEIVNLTPDITWIQVGNIAHDHRPLDGVINDIGRTDHRQLIRLIAHKDCRGVLTGESLCHHLAASFCKPCVTLAAPWLVPSWVSYSTATIICRMGCLPCCKTGACGASRVVELPDGDPKNKKLCKLPMVVDGDNVGKCMEDIKPEEVVQALQKYIRLGVA